MPDHLPALLDITTLDTVPGLADQEKRYLAQAVRLFNDGYCDHCNTEGIHQNLYYRRIDASVNDYNTRRYRYDNGAPDLRALYFAFRVMTPSNSRPRAGDL